MPRIAVVIVNYRTPELVVSCLDSLRGEGGDGLDIRVFVGDAASGDGSTERISAHIAETGMDNAVCFDIGVNGGFAFGNNAILRKHVLNDRSFDFVHFLNPDTYIRPGAVRALADFLRAHPEAGVAGSRLENPDGSLRAYAFRFPSPWREFFRGARLGMFDLLLPASRVHIPDVTETREVDWVTGASFMVPRAVLDRVGLMDDGYFLYFEEVDLMYRIRRAGHAIWHVAESRVVHLAGQSTGVRAGQSERRLPPYWFQSRYKFFRDRYGRVGAVAANLLFLAGDLVYRFHRVVLRRPVGDPPHLLRDFMTYGFSPPPLPEHGMGGGRNG